MSKSVSGRTAELARIAEKGCEVVYANTGFIRPNYWISRDIIIDFETRGLIECKGNQARVTSKGQRVLEGKAQ
jgi:ribosomal protein S19E (S16A)